MKEQDHGLECCGNHRPGSALKPRTAACSPQPLTGSEQTAVNANLAAGNSLKHTSRLLLNRTSAKPAPPNIPLMKKKRKGDLVLSSPRKTRNFEEGLTEILVDTGACIGKQKPPGKDTEAGCSQEWPLTPCSPEHKNALWP